MIYAYGDDIHANAWWYAIAFAMDKKISFLNNEIFWSWRWDSNPRPADYESAALPTEPLQRLLYDYTNNFALSQVPK